MSRSVNYINFRYQILAKAVWREPTVSSLGYFERNPVAFYPCNIRRFNRSIGMPLSTILIILLIILLLGGFSGRFGGYGYGFGHGGVGVIGTILIILLVLMLLGRI